MHTKTLLRWLGIFMIFHGVLNLICGKSCVRPWRRLGEPIATFVSFFLRWPGWLIRLAGVGEAAAGIRILGAAPFPVPAIYRVAAPIYDAVRMLWDAAVDNGVEEAVDEAVRKYLPSGGSVLDLGCGTGVNLARLLRLGLPFSRYVGIDLTPEMLQVARQKFGHLPNVTFLQLDLLRDPPPQGEFDLVVSTWVMSHLKEKAGEVVEKARERLKPNGHVVLLMFSETDSLLDPVVDAISSPFQIKPVPSDVYLSFPCRLSVQRLAGGIATIIVLRQTRPS